MLLKKVVPHDKDERWFIGSTVVIAANAGGAWTPIGDVTTTMLWVTLKLLIFRLEDKLPLYKLLFIYFSLLFFVY